MGIRLHCDRCGRFMSNISAKNFKQSIQNGTESICTICKKIEQAVLNDITRIRKKAEADFLKLSNQYQELITEAVNKGIEDHGNTDSPGAE